jgi:Uma2 family endonuclease
MADDLAPTPLALSRRKFTAADVQRMLDTGLLTDRDKVELIEGELIETAPQGPQHLRLTQKLVSFLLRNLPETVDLASQGPLRLGTYNEPEPDLFLFPAGMDVNDVRGPDVILAIEVSVSSLAYDRALKRDIHARHGVRVYWVIDIEAQRTLVFDLSAQDADPQEVAFTTPLAVAGVDITLATLV